MRLAVALALALALTGCLDGISSKGVVKSDKAVSGDVEVKGGHLRIEPGAAYLLERGTLALSQDPSIVVDGEIEVRGELTLREVTITGLYRIVVQTTGRLVMDNVTVAPSSVPATLIFAGNRSTVRGLDAEVYTIIVRGPTQIAQSQLRSTTLLPVIQARGPVEVTDTAIDSAGYGILVEAGDAVVRSNTVAAGTNGTLAAIAVKGGRAMVENNTITRGAIGIAFDGASGRVVGNTVRNATASGIAALGTGPLEIAQNAIEGAGRAGIYVKDGGRDTLVRANVVSGVAGQGWSGSLAEVAEASAGIAIDGGSPTVQENDVTGCENGIAVLSGTPAIHQNNIEASTHYGILYNVTAGQAPLDVTMNWWGSPSGPVPNTPTPVPGPSAEGAQRVGPGLVYSPWLVTRRA